MQGIDRLAALAKKKGKLNVAFVCSLLRGQPETCMDLLVAAGRAPEASFLARTYLPSKTSQMVHLWKENLRQVPWGEMPERGLSHSAPPPLKR